jgi:hypothetical protein
LKVLHGPTNVGNQAWSLSSAERVVAAREGLDFKTYLADFFPAGFAYGGDLVYRKDASSLMSKALRAAEMMGYGLMAMRAYDLFHLYFGKSFLNPFPQLSFGYPDIRIMNALGRKCFMTFQGCDARSREASKSRQQSVCHECTHVWCDERLDRVKRKNIAILAANCARVFCLNPDLVCQVPNAEFLPYCTYSPKPACQRIPGRRPMVLHPPTDRDIKGTKYVIEAFTSLQAEFDVDCVLVENLPHHEALALYRRADLVVDQLLAGWYGGVAVEVMQMGIPVVASICEEDLVHIPREMKEELPIIRATPEDISEVLARAISEPARLSEAGVKSKAYVEKWHNPLAIARAMIRVYHDPGRSFWSEYRALMGYPTR